MAPELIYTPANFHIYFIIISSRFPHELISTYRIFSHLCLLLNFNWFIFLLLFNYDRFFFCYVLNNKRNVLWLGLLFLPSLRNLASSWNLKFLYTRIFLFVQKNESVHFYFLIVVYIWNNHQLLYKESFLSTVETAHLRRTRTLPKSHPIFEHI